MVTNSAVSVSNKFTSFPERLTHSKAEIRSQPVEGMFRPEESLSPKPGVICNVSHHFLAESQDSLTQDFARNSSYTGFKMEAKVQKLI